MNIVLIVLALSTMPNGILKTRKKGRLKEMKRQKLNQESQKSSRLVVRGDQTKRFSRWPAPRVAKEYNRTIQGRFVVVDVSSKVLSAHHNVCLYSFLFLH